MIGSENNSDEEYMWLKAMARISIFREPGNLPRIENDVGFLGHIRLIVEACKCAKCYLVDQDATTKFKCPLSTRVQSKLAISP